MYAYYYGFVEKSDFFYLGFLSRTFTIHKTAGKGSLPPPPVSQILKEPSDNCRELTSAHS